MEQSEKERLVKLIIFASLAVAAVASFVFEDRGIFTKTIVGLCIFVVGLHSYYPLPPNTIGERRLFGWRAPAWLLIKRGWGFWIPGFLGGHVEHFTLLSLKMSGVVEVITADKTGSTPGVPSREVVLDIPWFLEFNIDPMVLDSGRVKFLGLDWNVVHAGSANFQKSKLSKVCGTLSSDDIVNGLRELEDYLRGFIMCKTPPHLSDPSCKDPVGWYRDHTDAIKGAERGSHFEREYGICVRVFRLEFPGYTDETKKAIAEEYQARRRREAAEQVLATAQKLQENLAVSGEKALDSAKLLHQIPNVREVIIGGSSIPILNLGDLAGGGSSSHGGAKGSAKKGAI